MRNLKKNYILMLAFLACILNWTACKAVDGNGIDADDISPSAFLSYEDSDIENAEAASAENGPLYRLPNTTYPIEYHLHITTNIHKGIFDFYGNCTIEIMIVESTNELVLHVYNLSIFMILVNDLTTNSSMKNLNYRIQNEMLIIYSTENSDDTATTVQMKNFMRNHRIRLEIHYSSVISADSTGFYQMTYITKEGDKRFGAMTQFEPVYARKALPCYDEPKFKSKFTVRMTHGNNFTAISNMPNDGRPITSSNNMTTTTFLKTPKMPVYLLAFVLSNFQNTSLKTDDLLQRLFLSPSFDKELNATKFLDDANRIVKALEDLVNVKYSLPKLDHILVNELFGRGMENWGLITYSNNFLTTLDLKEGKDFNYLMVLAHEIVHQWFGNLVTPEWWTYLWLSEGFATYYSFVLIDILRPEYKALEYHQLYHCIEGRNFHEDIVVTQYVEAPLDIRGVFNTPLYWKAGCMVEMLEHTFGQDVFRKALSSYLKTNAFSTVTENDLFNALQDELMQNFNYIPPDGMNSVVDFMHNWTNSGVYPMVKVTRNYGNQSSIIKVEQIPLGEDKDMLLWVPLNFVTSSNASFESTLADCFLPPVKEYFIDLETFGITLRPEDWIILNKKGTNYYKVVYDNSNRDLITKALLSNHDSIHARNRMAYISDMLSTNDDLKQNSEVLIMRLECIKYLKNEDDPLVWMSALPLMEMLFDEVSDNDFAEELMKNFLLKLAMPRYDNLSKMSTEQLTVQDDNLLEDFQYLLCKLGVEKCLEDQKVFVLKFIDGKHNDKNETIFRLCSAAKLFNETEFERALVFIFDEHKLESGLGLSCTKNESLYEELLKKLLLKIESENDCINNLNSFINLLKNKKNSKHKNTWSILKEKMPRILGSPCGDAFFEMLNWNLMFIDKSHTAELRNIYEFHKNFSTIFNETMVGSKLPLENHNAAIIANVTEWLREEQKKPNIIK